jgi:hypothetical protein
MNIITRTLAAGMALALPAFSYAALEAITDDEMSSITGQALFLSDKIVGSTADANPYNDFTFYRLAVDADLLFNLNIDRLQLGCGGFNEGVPGGLDACDIDVDFTSFSGSGGPNSDFLLRRPYLEIAIKDDGDKTRRSVAGVKIGSQSAEGIMSIGRVHTSGTNPELGGATACNPGYTSAEDNGSRLACHSGANRFSAYLFGEMSGYGRITSGFGNANVCFGLINAPNGCNSNQALFLAISGTRMQQILAINRPLVTESCSGALALLFCPDGNADIRENLRFLHRVELNSTGTAPRITRDFFLSFQRERIAYPIYDQAQPYDTDGNGSTTDTYSATANTGWWMNITYASARNLNVGTLNLVGFDALDALGEGANAVDINLNQTPVDNCFGSAVFC